jgi:hypothetical protein
MTCKQKRPKTRLKAVRHATEADTVTDTGTYLPPYPPHPTAVLQSYFLDRPLDYSEFSDFDASYRPRRPYYSLLKHQERIGWDHFLRGKLSHH